MTDQKSYIISLDGKVLGCEVKYADHESCKATAGKSSGTYSAGSFTLNLGDEGRQLFGHLTKVLEEAGSLRHQTVITFSDSRTGTRLAELCLSDVDERVDLPKLLDALARSLSVLGGLPITAKTKATAQAIVAREVARANEVAR